jgi:predicted PurR-regulated permease PerM
VLLALAGVWMIEQLWNVVLVMTVALVLVGTFDPLVVGLERRGLRRGWALALLFVFVAFLIAALLFVTVPPLIAQVQHMIEDAPNERHKVVVFLDQYGWTSAFANQLRHMKIDNLVLEAGDKFASYGSEILKALGYAVTTLFLAIYLLADPSRAKGLLYAVVPRTHHIKLAKILIELKTIVGGYMRGQLITSVAITIFTFTLLTVLRVPDALALAMFAGLTDVIPFIGGYLASAPAVIAVSPSGGGVMVLVAILMFAYQEFESRILVPRVYGRTLRMPPAVVLVALLIGGTLLGILGALLALPIAAGLQMVVRELRVELPGEAPSEGATERRERDEKAERAYEKLAAGEPVEKAAAIARDIAEKMKESDADGERLSLKLEALKDEDEEKK